MTRGLVKAVGPTRQVSRPGWSAGLPVAPTAPIFFQQAVLGLLVWSMLVLACLDLSKLGFDNFCDFMSGQSVLVTCILAQKHNLHFLEGKV